MIICVATVDDFDELYRLDLQMNEFRVSNMGRLSNKRIILVFLQAIEEYKLRISGQGKMRVGRDF